MIYQLNLQITHLTVGSLLVISHVIALASSEKLAVSLTKFPRSRMAGVLLLTIAAAWSFWLMTTMDLGEFTSKRTLLQAIVPIAYLLTLFFVEEFLAVRALGMVALLAACLLLDAAFLNPDPARLALVVLAYVWIICALFMVGKPYLLRNAIEWLNAKKIRLQAACVSGIIYGALLIVIAITRFKS